MGKFSVKDIMNAPAPAEPEATTQIQPRTIDLITAEINYYKQQTVQNIIEIGKRLIEAKGRLRHGEWADWLKSRVEFSERTARNFMQIANEYSNRQPVADLPYTKLLALLQVPAEEREEFLAESHVVNGEEKTVADMSKRELEQAIKAREAEKQRADAEKQRADAADRRAETAEKKAEQAKQDFDEIGRISGERYKTILQLQRRLRELESKPIDVAVEEPSEERIAEIRQEAQEKANRESQQLRQEIAGLKRQMASAGVSEGRTEDATDTFCAAVDSVFEQYETILQSSKPSAICGFIDDAIGAIDCIREKLRQAQARAGNCLIADEDVDLPEDLR